MSRSLFNTNKVVFLSLSLYSRLSIDSFHFSSSISFHFPSSISFHFPYELLLFNVIQKMVLSLVGWEKIYSRDYRTNLIFRVHPFFSGGKGPTEDPKVYCIIHGESQRVAIKPRYIESRIKSIKVSQLM